MIYDSFEHMDQYFHKDDPIHKALAFALGFDAANPDGRYEIDGSNIYALVSSYETSPAEERRFEGHRMYVDVQLLLEGEERIDVSLSSNLQVLEQYSETKDALFLETPPDFASIAMRPGLFATFFPHDLHRPNCNLHGKVLVRKMVLKVRAE